MKWLPIIIALFLTHWVAYIFGQSDIKRHIVVRFGAPYYHGGFYGSCQTEVWFAGERGMACATLDYTQS